MLSISYTPEEFNHFKDLKLLIFVQTISVYFLLLVYK